MTERSEGIESTALLGGFRVDGKDYKWDNHFKAYLTHYMHDEAIGAKQLQSGEWVGCFCGEFDDYTQEAYETPQQAAIRANSFFT